MSDSQLSSLQEQLSEWIQCIKDAHDESLNDNPESSRAMLRAVIREMEEACAQEPPETPEKMTNERIAEIAMESGVGVIEFGRDVASARDAQWQATRWRAHFSSVPDWAACERIAESSEVDEALHLFAQGEATHDQAVAIVQAVLTAAQPRKGGE